MVTQPNHEMPLRDLPPLERLTVGPITMAYRRAGSGPPLILFHGAYEDSRYWAPQLAGLSDEFTVIAVDAPGFGHSDDPPPTWTATDCAHALAEFIGGLGVGSVHVLGLSFGSLLALLLYREKSQAVRSLVLASAYAGWAGSLPAEEVESRISMGMQELDLPPSEIVPRWLPTLLTPSASAETVSVVASMFADFHREGMRWALGALSRIDLRDVLATIRVPTLLVYGGADVRSPADVVGADLHAKIPDSTLVVIPEAPHLSSLERPDAFNDAVRDFLTSLGHA